MEIQTEAVRLLCRGQLRDRITTPLPMRVRVSDPALLGDLCDFLSRRGYACAEASDDEAQILAPGESDFRALSQLMSDVGIWRATRAEVQVLVQAGP